MVGTEALAGGLIMANSVGTLAQIDPEHIEKNPQNPRRYFNDERLDILRTSIQEVGILVPLIVYRKPAASSAFVLMDGERRWRCSMDLGLIEVPANVIDAPSPLENLLRMFNIHNVREDWPLISVALSLQDVIRLSKQTGELRLAEMTGLTRSSVRRAKRLLTIPPEELELVQAEAHLDRTKQIHREDLYLEIEAAESVLRSELPEVAKDYTRERIIRKFAEKAEVDSQRPPGSPRNLPSVTDFRFVGKLAKAAGDELVDRNAVIAAARELIEDSSKGPREVFDSVAAYAFNQQSLLRKAELFHGALKQLDAHLGLSAGLTRELTDLRATIDRLTSREPS